ncbi:hypothetical protein GOP47_0023776 [Adiantum capillus-veneris]|uniref:Uncharacterized protein n=1 Tax=Adiantum capillus-veneris TaxID=13818 RepID=A0A9D4Z690_ADICA|nr:hypothetical protein GOP47_0023776 [Adiantum capillus-veneris]
MHRQTWFARKASLFLGISKSKLSSWMQDFMEAPGRGFTVPWARSDALSRCPLRAYYFLRDDHTSFTDLLGFMVIILLNRIVQIQTYLSAVDENNKNDFIEIEVASAFRISIL